MEINTGRSLLSKPTSTERPFLTFLSMHLRAGACWRQGSCGDADFSVPFQRSSRQRDVMTVHLIEGFEFMIVAIAAMGIKAIFGLCSLCNAFNRYSLGSPVYLLIKACTNQDECIPREKKSFIFLWFMRVTSTGGESGNFHFP